MISKETIGKILGAARVEEVINDFVTLKKRGANLIARCPFHDEKTPSFTVSPAKGIYKCFGCGVAGNVVGFVMEHEGYTYPEALRYLAEKYNIEMEDLNPEELAHEKEELQQKESLYIINNFAQKYFTKTLLEHEEGKSIGQSYFKERGFREETIRKFQLGYALATKDAFTNEATQKQYKLEYLKELGLTATRNDIDMDFFRERVMFPINNLSGKVIAFGARTLRSDPKIPKYINSPESQIYNKSKVVYGLYFAKEAIRKSDECYMVEGYTDVISLHQSGIENVVASAGTSLTKDQIRLISRYTKDIILLFDGDEAGINASFRGIDMILEQDMNVKVVILPEGEDPDSYVNKLGASDFKNHLEENKKDFILLKTDILLKETKNDPIKKAGIINDIVTSISKIPDHIKRSVFVKECSTLLDMDEQILFRAINKLRRNAFKKNSGLQEQEVENLEHLMDDPAKANQPSLTSDDNQERDIIRVLLEFGDKEIEEGKTLADYIIDELEDIELNDELFTTILKGVKDLREKGEAVTTEYFINNENPEISKLAIDLTTSAYELSENWYKKHKIVVKDKAENYKEDVYSSVAHLIHKKVTKTIKENDEKLKDNLSQEEIQKIQEKHIELKSLEKNLSSYLGTVVSGNSR